MTNGTLKVLQAGKVPATAVADDASACQGHGGQEVNHGSVTASLAPGCARFAILPTQAPLRGVDALVAGATLHGFEALVASLKPTRLVLSKHTHTPTDNPKRKVY